MLKTRAAPIGITLEITPIERPYGAGCFGALLSYPGSTGEVRDIKPEIDAVQAAGGMVVAMTCWPYVFLDPPGALGADIVLGSAQRFGVPVGYGGPHAAFFATKTAHQRSIPWASCRSPARMPKTTQALSPCTADTGAAYPPREGHIEHLYGAGSAGCHSRFYAIWHGPEGLMRIANHAHDMACRFAAAMRRAGHMVRHDRFFGHRHRSNNL